MEESRKINCKICGTDFYWTGVFVHENCLPQKCDGCKGRKSHLKKWTIKKRECRQCGGHIPSIVHGSATFCSSDCRDESRRKKQNDYARRLRPDRFCENCERKVENGKSILCGDCREKIKQRLLIKLCESCGHEMALRAWGARECNKCSHERIKKDRKERAERRRRKPAELGRDAATVSSVFRGAISETLFRLLCNHAEVVTYWPDSSTNKGVDCIVDIGGNPVRIQIKTNRSQSSNLNVVQWRSEQTHRTGAFDLLAVVDIGMQAVTLIGPHEYDYKSRSTTIKPSQWMSINDTTNSQFTSNVLNAMTGVAIM